MKKLYLTLCFILVFQLGHGIMPALGQRDEDSAEIESVVRHYYNAFVNDDPASALNYISENYSLKVGNQEIDYEQFVDTLHKSLARRRAVFTDYIIDELRTSDIEVEGEKATVDVEAYVRAFNTRSNQDQSWSVRRKIYLTKENGVWKITGVRGISQGD